MPSAKRDVLIGKNLAVAPLALGLCVPIIVLIQAVAPMRIDHFLALFPQFATMYLLYCLWGNSLAILAPIPIASGTLKPSNPKAVTVLVQLVFILLLPMVLAPSLLPFGAEYLAERFGGWGKNPLYLILSLVVCAIVTLVYWGFVTLQGVWLQSREQDILQVVASNAE